jgi:site-specific DNA-methyltransferase (adenine-specific)
MMIEEQKDDSGSVSLPFGKQTVVGSTVILGDCVEVMKGFPDNQFDLAIVDPPYGINIIKQFTRPNNTGMMGKKTMNMARSKSCFDNSIPDKLYFDELFRVSKNQIIWGGNYFLDYLGATDGFLIWDKMNGTNSMADAELAWKSFEGASRMFRMHHFSAGYDDKIHPTQKPTKLYDWIFDRYSKQGDKILDTHLGSGSSRIAADKAGLDFTGIEIDKEYFDLSEKRFKQYKSQLRIEGW